MNKILFNALQYQKEGAGISRYTQRLLETFIKEGYPVDILRRGEVVDECHDKRFITVDKNLSSSTKRIIEEQWQQRKLYKQYELVHFPDYATPLIYNGIKVATIHDMAMHTMRDKYTLMQNITKRVLLEATVRQAQYLICDSEFAKKELLHYYPNIRGEITVIPLGIDEPTVQIDLLEAKKIIKELGIQKKYMLSVGTLAPHKNITYLIESFAEIKKEYSEYQLVIVGKKGWMYEKIFESVKRLGLEKDVIFTGFVTDDQLEALYRTAQFYVTLSLYEGFGLPPLEAMIRKCPVLVSDLEIFRETCQEYALFCDIHNKRDVIMKMKTFITNEECRRQFAILGEQHAKQFKWQMTAQKTYEVYERGLNRKGEER